MDKKGEVEFGIRKLKKPVGIDKLYGYAFSANYKVRSPSDLEAIKAFAEKEGYKLQIPDLRFYGYWYSKKICSTICSVGHSYQPWVKEFNHKDRSFLTKSEYKYLKTIVSHPKKSTDKDITLGLLVRTANHNIYWDTSIKITCLKEIENDKYQIKKSGNCKTIGTSS